jgi:hypothetical protein
MQMSAQASLNIGILVQEAVTGTGRRSSWDSDNPD